MTFLDDLAVKHGTDKGSIDHGYCDAVYADLFNPLCDAPVMLVELGIYQGASLRMWDDFFTNPDADIIGIDINPNHPSVGGRRVRAYQCDQAETPEQLRDRHPDIIIDDASHISSKTIASFLNWFPRLSPGGLYIIEDVVTSYYFDHAPGELTTMQFCQSLADGVQGYADITDLEWIRFHRNIVVMKKLGNND